MARSHAPHEPLPDVGVDILAGQPLAMRIVETPEILSRPVSLEPHLQERPAVIAQTPLAWLTGRIVHPKAATSLPGAAVAAPGRGPRSLHGSDGRLRPARAFHKRYTPPDSGRPRSSSPRRGTAARHRLCESRPVCLLATCR